MERVCQVKICIDFETLYLVNLMSNMGNWITVELDVFVDLYIVTTKAYKRFGRFGCDN
jgi:hypothetical protein